MTISRRGKSTFHLPKARRTRGFTFEVITNILFRPDQMKSDRATKLNKWSTDFHEQECAW
jgi:hypothetical protein